VWAVCSLSLVVVGGGHCRLWTEDSVVGVCGGGVASVWGGVSLGARGGEWCRGGGRVTPNSNAECTASTDLDFLLLRYQQPAKAGYFL